MTLTLPQATFAPDADRPLVTIVIPTFNERDNIAVICGRIAASLDRHPFEVIVVDDDSPDGTSAVVESLAKADSRIRIITRTGRRGLAGACIEGMLAARSELVAVMDADLQHEPATLVPMLDLMASTKCDIIIASRYVDDPDVAAFSSVRQALSNAGNRLVRALLRVQTSDPMSGFFLMRRSILVKAEPRLSRDGFKLLADILVQGGRAMKIRGGSLRLRAPAYRAKQARREGSLRLRRPSHCEIRLRSTSDAVRLLRPGRWPRCHRPSGPSGADAIRPER